MKVLQARLAEIRRKKERRGEDERAWWASSERSSGATRSGLRLPAAYTLVKDHRTNAETKNIIAVMDGEIDPLIHAYLTQFREFRRCGSTSRSCPLLAVGLAALFVATPSSARAQTAAGREIRTGQARQQETGFGNGVADAILRRQRAEIAWVAGGEFRDTVPKTGPGEDFVVLEDPADPLTVVPLTGQTIREALEFQLSRSSIRSLGRPSCTSPVCASPLRRSNRPAACSRSPPRASPRRRPDLPRRDDLYPGDWLLRILPTLAEWPRPGRRTDHRGRSLPPRPRQAASGPGDGSMAERPAE